VLGPLIDAAFERPDLGAVVHDTRDRQEEEGNAEQPEGNVSRTLARSEARPRHAHHEQNLHRDEIAQAEFPLHLIAAARHGNVGSRLGQANGPAAIRAL
jgi:hypothetical protein